MADFLTAEDAFLKARATFESWKASFEARYYGPVGDATLAAMWQSIPPEMHARLQAMDPAGYERLQAKIGGRYGTV